MPEKNAEKKKPASVKKPNKEKMETKTKKAAKKTEAKTEKSEREKGKEKEEKGKEEEKAEKVQSKKKKVRKAKPRENKEKKVPATSEEKALQEKIKAKTKQEFRGRFGKSSIRRPSKKKWQKWRKPRGIDFKIRESRLKIPKTGYRTEKSVRGLHPSGKKEILIHNEGGLLSLDGKNIAIRIATTVGKKKRIAIRKKCAELGLRVLN